MVSGPPEAPPPLDDAGCMVAPPVVQPGCFQIAAVPLDGLRVLLQLVVLSRSLCQLGL